MVIIWPKPPQQNFISDKALWESSHNRCSTHWHHIFISNIILWFWYDFFLNTFAAIYKLTKFTKLSTCQGEGILGYFLDTTHDNCAILRNVMNERITAWINASLDSSKSNSTSYATLYYGNLNFLWPFSIAFGPFYRKNSRWNRLNLATAYDTHMFNIQFILVRVISLALVLNYGLSKIYPLQKLLRPK